MSTEETFPEVNSHDWPLATRHHNGNVHFWLVVQPSHLGGAILGTLRERHADGRTTLYALAADGTDLEVPEQYDQHEAVRVLIRHHREQKAKAGTIRLPSRALGRLDAYLADMELEDQKPARNRDSRVYARAYAVVETYGLLLRVSPDPSDPVAVRAAVEAAYDYEIDRRERRA